MTLLPRGRVDFKSGTWEPATKADRVGGFKAKSAMVSCPKCGRVCSLSQHLISADGTVAPSLVCPFTGCDFHEYVKLEGWQP